MNLELQNNHSYQKKVQFSLRFNKNPKYFYSPTSRDFIFIRHARSVFNDACQKFRVQNNIPWNWDVLVGHPKFAQQVAYNKNYIDCSLTQQGIKQCLRARQKLKDQKVDIILVSPQQRALQTCTYIFSGRNIPVRVIPILNGPLWSACDLSGSYQQKKLEYPDYDFSQTEKQGQLWYLKHLGQEQRNLCLREFESKKVKTLLQKKLIILDLLKQGKIMESATYLRRRSDRLKQYLKKLHQSYEKIVIVSHYYKIQYAISKQFSQIDEPMNKIDIPNCTPYRVSQQELFRPTTTIKRAAI